MGRKITMAVLARPKQYANNFYRYMTEIHK